MFLKDYNDEQKINLNLRLEMLGIWTSMEYILAVTPFVAQFTHVSRQFRV